MTSHTKQFILARRLRVYPPELPERVGYHVLTDAPDPAVTTDNRENQGTVSLQRLSPPEDLQALDGKRNGVVIPSLHALRRNLPTRLGNVDLAPSRAGHLAKTSSGEHDEEHGQLDRLAHLKVLPRGQCLAERRSTGDSDGGGRET